MILQPLSKNLVLYSKVQNHIDKNNSYRELTQQFQQSLWLGVIDCLVQSKNFDKLKEINLLAAKPVGHTHQDYEEAQVFSAFSTEIENIINRGEIEIAFLNISKSTQKRNGIRIHLRQYLNGMFKTSLNEQNNGPICSLLSKEFNITIVQHDTYQNIYNGNKNLILYLVKWQRNWISIVQVKNLQSIRNPYLGQSNLQGQYQIKQQQKRSCQYCSKLTEDYEINQQCQHVLCKKCLNEDAERNWKAYKNVIPKCLVGFCYKEMDIQIRRKFFSNQQVQKCLKCCDIQNIITPACGHSICNKCLKFEFELYQALSIQCPQRNCRIQIKKHHIKTMSSIEVDKEKCCACKNKKSNNEMYFEICGHCYCRQCVQIKLKSSTTMCDEQLCMKKVNQQKMKEFLNEKKQPIQGSEPQNQKESKSICGYCTQNISSSQVYTNICGDCICKKCHLIVLQKYPHCFCKQVKLNEQEIKQYFAGTTQKKTQKEKCSNCQTEEKFQYLFNPPCNHLLCLQCIEKFDFNVLKVPCKINFCSNMLNTTQLNEFYETKTFEMIQDQDKQPLILQKQQSEDEKQQQLESIASLKKQICSKCSHLQLSQGKEKVFQCEQCYDYTCSEHQSNTCECLCSVCQTELDRLKKYRFCEKCQYVACSLCNKKESCNFAQLKGIMSNHLCNQEIQTQQILQNKEVILQQTRNNRFNDLNQENFGYHQQEPVQIKQVQIDQFEDKENNKEHKIKNLKPTKICLDKCRSNQCNCNEHYCANCYENLNDYFRDKYMAICNVHLLCGLCFLSNQSCLNCNIEDKKKNIPSQQKIEIKHIIRRQASSFILNRIDREQLYGKPGDLRSSSLTRSDVYQFQKQQSHSNQKEQKQKQYNMGLGTFVIPEYGNKYGTANRY